jgi:glutamyl-tRNA reductase
VREAVGNARAGRTLDGRLLRLFETAIAAGRRARAGRTASSGNLAQRAVAWLGEKSSLVGNTVLVAGAGRMGSSLAHSAKLAGADIVIASRDATRARRLAHVYGGDSTDLAGGAQLALQAAGVAVALAGGPIRGAGCREVAVEQRLSQHRRPLRAQPAGSTRVHRRGGAHRGLEDW